MFTYHFYEFFVTWCNNEKFIFHIRYTEKNISSVDRKPRSGLPGELSPSHGGVIVEKDKKFNLMTAKVLLLLSIPIIASAFGLTALTIYHILNASNIKLLICCDIGTFIVVLRAIAGFWYVISFWKEN